ncbi:MAG TPA: FtsQ-type POTRA domain-containing protein [Stackebrandtia sp.]|jgi:cell division protein FtsQ|uniref:cell division protein FtsQ/DivIB n=1 Tax=Stackebrandtia sp. TaxID=2023065 RepID=UPI002D60FA31|nr:FtsQ-type POTRA domain-containing protein [Stackebrandtia sp.]HZE38151.1 FtsQ-type POTRA domain-containing protein [Stackebrandtia sp.]
MAQATDKRPSRARRWWTIGLSAVVLAAGGLGLVYGGVFDVESVQVKGTTFTKNADIIDAARIPKGTALASVDVDGAAARVAQVPEVRDVAVDRSWPHTVVITITERSGRLAVPTDKKFTLVDEKGVAFRTVAKRPAHTVLATLEHPGPDDQATTSVLTVLSALTPELKNRLVKITAKTPGSITLRLKGGRSVFWGDDSRCARKAEVATVLVKRSEKHFDVSAPDVPTVS